MDIRKLNTMSSIIMLFWINVRIKWENKNIQTYAWNIIKAQCMVGIFKNAVWFSKLISSWLPNSVLLTHILERSFLFIRIFINILILSSVYYSSFLFTVSVIAPCVTFDSWYLHNVLLPLLGCRLDLLNWF